MSERLVLCTSKAGIARIVLNREKQRNALTRSMIAELTDVLRQVAADRQVRVIVLAAAGPVFCAGMDLVEMQQRASKGSGEKEWLRDSLDYCDLLTTLLEVPQPTLAVVQGPVLAGGVGMILACDLVLAAETAFLSLPEPQRGITASMVTPLLVYRAGAGHASHLLLSGRRVPAAEMHHWGVCHQVVAPNQLDQTESEWIDSILKGSPLALAATKRHIRDAGGIDLAAQLKEAAQFSAQARATPDAREGLRAFLEKRDPFWMKLPDA
jgi:methylglutaconyl-CoA hydratase